MATLVSKKSTTVSAKSALLGQALRLVSNLPQNRQDAIAAQILETLEFESDPAAQRHQELIEQKYTRGLTAEDETELAELEIGFQQRDEAFYAPILERVASGVRPAAKRKTALKSK